MVHHVKPSKHLTLSCIPKLVTVERRAFPALLAGSPLTEAAEGGVWGSSLWGWKGEGVLRGRRRLDASQVKSPLLDEILKTG